MNYWRMQLHPSDPARSAAHAIRSVSAGFIGLDFESDVGDMRRISRESVSSGERDYFDFVSPMQVGDLVLVVAHHFQVALVTVSGEYNYIATPDRGLGVWFRHFRRIDTRKTLFWADHMTNAKKWEPITMTDTIARLQDPKGKTYQLIEEWRREATARASVEQVYC
ncbi:MAG: hypothetical protein KF838_00330 [Phycisphaeraceae bacterium]|nr:MAG: hypothetical protein KF838_00330 [Phycisphaeraceae bacterium]